MPILRSSAVNQEASTEGNPDATPTKSASRKRQRDSAAAATPSAKSASLLDCTAGTPMERLDIEESMAKKELMDSFSDPALEDFQQYPPGGMYMLQTLADNIDRETMNHDAIRSFLDKEHTLGKDLQCACDAELEEVDDKVENLREENRVLTSRVEAIMDSIEPYAQYR
ncbi:hypothetical protein FMUND_6717 [Fusarium mundagurra]|uniref:Uncharacterized protein n=1 Tax=Fusarium mundagurra TaxID=1567541 RepID=A0A8H6DFD2_9HYPO|nr:hypothetical protein FMUND_6717 [Fusarium mundagurra]